MIKRVISAACAMLLWYITCLPAISKDFDSVKTFNEGSVTAMAKEEMIKRLESQLNSPSRIKIDKQAIYLEPGFDYFPKDSKINLVIKDVEVASILKILAKEGKMNIIIDPSVLGYMSADIKNTSLNQAMETILISQELEARVRNNTIFVASRPVMAKKGLNRSYIKTIKLNNADPVYVADILRASIFNKGYKVKETAAGGSANVAAFAEITTVSDAAKDTSQTSTGQSNLSDSKTIRGKVESLQPGEGFNDGGSLASQIKMQQTVKETRDIVIDNNDGGAIVIPDPRTNSLLISGLQKDILLAEEAIRYLDKPLKQVSIKVSLIEVKQTDAKDLGLYTNMEGGKMSGGFNANSSDKIFDITSYDNDNNSVSRKFSNYTADNTTGITLNTLGSLRDNIAIRLQALITNEQARLLANPTIVALDSSESMIKITDQVVNKVETTVSDGTTTYSVELADVGIVLNILPKIGDDDNITMRVRPSISSALPRQTIGTGASAVQITPISTREVILQDVRVKSGETLSIAGLTNEKDTNTQGKIPYLSNIPGMGNLFKNSSYNREKTELIILITPVIIDDVARL